MDASVRVVGCGAAGVSDGEVALEAARDFRDVVLVFKPVELSLSLVNGA